MEPFEEYLKGIGVQFLDTRDGRWLKGWFRKKAAYEKMTGSEKGTTKNINIESYCSSIEPR
ncbi:MAG: hypothetical protein ABC585_05805 [Candidatus Methanosuratincola petrocarbonis]